ncbi:DUF432 domain-containing protein [Methanomethylovorans sp.]|uniref:DUF432 domain-containing protein n=2 Tax=Methanomethylovorans sp. TaxID=2758717 RepID=UPI00351C2905
MEIIMFGVYESPFNMEIEDVSISVEIHENSLIYRRWGSLGSTEKLLLQESCSFLLNPIEPVNMPKRLTHFLLVDFQKTVILEPGATRKVYITFPIEVGVFVSHEKEEFELIDIFSFARLKYTLYGVPSNGIICKYWKSDVSLSPPDTNPLHTGYIDLKIVNDTDHMIEINKAIFNAYGMKIYYEENKVVMKAVMKIPSRKLAETEFIHCPGKGRFKKAMELYVSSKLRVSGTKCIMEYGL